MTRRISAALAISAGVALCGACAPAMESDQMVVLDRDAREDVRLTRCEFTPGGAIDAAVSVTNSTNRVSSYLVVAAAFDAKGNRLSDLNAVASAVQPGHTIEALAPGYAPGATPTSCRTITATALSDINQ